MWRVETWASGKYLPHDSVKGLTVSLLGTESKILTVQRPALIIDSTVDTEHHRHRKINTPDFRFRTTMLVLIHILRLQPPDRLLLRLIITQFL